MKTLHHQIAFIQQQIESLSETLSQLSGRVEAKPMAESQPERQEKEIGIIRYRKLHGKGWHYSRGYAV